LRKFVARYRKKIGTRFLNGRNANTNAKCKLKFDKKKAPHNVVWGFPKESRGAESA